MHFSGKLSAAAAGTFRLGDRTVNRLGFGAMRLSGTGGMGRGTDRDPEQSAAVVRRAVELGVNHIDTAAFYFSASARANEVIRAALAPYPDDLAIVTKIGPGRDLATGEWGDWLRPDQLRAHVEHNLETLGMDRLPVVNYRSNGRDDVPAAVAALAGLRDAGLLDHIGLSNVGLDVLECARRVAPIVCVQNRHAPGYERSDTGEVLGRCAELGIAFVPFFAVAGRSRENTAEEEYDAVRQIAHAHGVTPAQVRIAWNLALGPHALAIPGTGDLAHLEQNVAAASLRLTEGELAALSTLAGQESPPMGRAPGHRPRRRESPPST
ncbi:MAG TPA: aldo/keto reductase [Marmoricola sp.]|nr:aldo/keto reductase [Marmoricola sp.]